MTISATAVVALAALAQETRLNVFRLLVQVGPAGLAAGEIGAQLAIPANTLSFHLKTLSQAGLLESRQDGRFVFYAANYASMDDLIAFLTDNCCNGASVGNCLPKTATAAKTTRQNPTSAQGSNS